jgi:demethylmenaquinone methyltransferase / 2-methoxy-6-polyprenyl-1,4-benzoquinol methylase
MSGVTGTRPAGASDERDAARRVREMFTRITPRYDLLNHLLSVGMDRAWRRRTAEHFAHVLRRADSRVLDLCCGTGDLAFAFDTVRSAAPSGRDGAATPILGADFVLPMLERGRQKAAAHHRHVLFIAADALNLPFGDGRFDLVATAFGFRNLANYAQGLREFARVLRQGGEVGILEFSEPAGSMAALFRFYFRHVLPKVGNAVSGSSDAYTYLPDSVAKFPTPQELTAMMQRCGFINVGFEAWNFGSVVLHWGART